MSSAFSQTSLMVVCSGRLRIRPRAPSSLCWTITTTLWTKLGSTRRGEAMRSWPWRLSMARLTLRQRGGCCQGWKSDPSPQDSLHRPAADGERNPGADGLCRRLVAGLDGQLQGPAAAAGGQPFLVDDPLDRH